MLHGKQSPWYSSCRFPYVGTCTQCPGPSLKRHPLVRSKTALFRTASPHSRWKIQLFEHPLEVSSPGSSRPPSLHPVCSPRTLSSAPRCMATPEALQTPPGRRRVLPALGPHGATVRCPPTDRLAGYMLINFSPCASSKQHLKLKKRPLRVPNVSLHSCFQTHLDFPFFLIYISKGIV